MKKILSISLLAAVLASGCLKDKDYDDQRYGIQDTEVKGISFPRRSVAVGLTADATPQSINGVTVGLNSTRLPSTNVAYTVTSNPAAIPTGTTPVPANAFTFVTSGVIEAGQYVDTLTVSLTNASLLDPNIKYGIALTIATVDNGYTIAENSKTVVISISIKNKYDGKYSLRGIHNRPPYNAFPYANVTVEMETTGPSSVAMYVPVFGDYGHPIGTAPGAINWYGNGISPEFTFNPVTNLVTGIRNYVGTTSLFLGPVPGRWDPSTKTMYLQFFYTTGANQDFSNRGWSDTLTYVGPR